MSTQVMPFDIVDTITPTFTVGTDSTTGNPTITLKLESKQSDGEKKTVTINMNALVDLIDARIEAAEAAS